MSRYGPFRWVLIASGAVVVLLLVALAVAGVLPRPFSNSAQANADGSGPAAVSLKPYTAAEVQSVDAGTSLGDTPAPDFTLVDQFGHTVSLHDFRGKAVVLSFDDDQCTTICPLTAQVMRAAKQALGPAGSNVVLLAVNANPDHTAVADVKAFSVQHGMLNDWLFLTGSRAQLEQVWKAYNLDVQIVNGSIDHTPAVFLIGPHGNERSLYLTSTAYGVVPLEAAPLAAAIARTLPGHPSVASLAGAAGGPVNSPADPVTLPGLVDGTSAPLGGTSARLVVFFASWAPDLGANLTNLDAYAAAARGGRVPPVTAVDVMSTEPSLAAAQAAVRGLSPALSYPVVMDQTGRVADAYGVQDIPWIALVDHGRVVWSHDGWLPAATLETEVARALGPSATP
ncbi:MAG TPA: SCO family protein [Thermomicrobiaceae bacterium]|nr:SCO family protein [Thermomicrobiaceae bacterium]